MWLLFSFWTKLISFRGSGPHEYFFKLSLSSRHISGLTFCTEHPTLHANSASISLGLSVSQALLLKFESQSRKVAFSSRAYCGYLHFICRAYMQEMVSKKYSWVDCSPFLVVIVHLNPSLTFPLQEPQEPTPRLTPVSYTHLDVYKRQVPRWRVADDPAHRAGRGNTRFPFLGHKKRVNTWQQRERIFWMLLCKVPKLVCGHIPHNLCGPGLQQDHLSIQSRKLHTHPYLNVFYEIRVTVLVCLAQCYIISQRYDVLA